MIEILGVLAIIGVLTVGSITGYSHAMRRHLLNKQREQISTILATIETQYGALKSSASDLSTNPLSIFKNLGWVPEDMIQDNTGFVYDIFKNRALFKMVRAPTYQLLGFYVYLNNGNAFEQCVNLYQVAIPFHSSLYAVEIHQDDGYGSIRLGDMSCSANNCLRNSTPSDIARFCQRCKDNSMCNIYYFWRFER